MPQPMKWLPFLTRKTKQKHIQQSEAAVQQNSGAPTEFKHNLRSEKNLAVCLQRAAVNLGTEAAVARQTN